MILTPAVNLIEDFRKNGKQKPLRMMIDASTPTGLIDPYDVGIVAAHLLAQEKTVLHNQRRYVFNGPEDVTGERIVKLVEQHVSEAVNDVRFKDLSMIDQMVDDTNESKNVIGSIKLAPTTSWAGQAKAKTTSKEILELYGPKRTASEVLKKLLKA
ncbi:hypothetical protein LTR49_024485 [Elasticomyces elasticus]|nr:hypothetical protein LTR49_024485 [Elasticomyces elasticus]